MFFLLLGTCRVTRLRPGYLHVFSVDMILPTMLAPHRTTYPATTGIVTQLSEDTGYLWCGFTGTDTSSCNQASRLARFPRLEFLTT